MPTGKKVTRPTKPGPAAPNPPKADGVLRTVLTPTEPQAKADRIDFSDTAMDAQNWRIIKPLLADRIRRRREALRRLAGEEECVHATESLMATEGDDAAALWRLAEQLDSRLDRAFATRARHAPLQDKPNRAGQSTAHDDYKAH